MSVTFYFYDLETSGFSPREARIMQFAGQRTSLDLKPIGEPVNVFLKLSDDILPDPGAILVTGITPQSTAGGLTEAEFLKLFSEDISTPGTIFVGFNTVRFDDEFMRFLHYRNFYDAYEWEWRDGRGRWDLLDVVRMTRALRPDGINWPFDTEGRPTNRLELLTALNGLDHSKAHDALNDVLATIEIAKMLQKNQPKLFNFLFEMREKQKVAEFVMNDQPFVYTSGKYSSEFEKTTVVCTIGQASGQQNVLVYDLRFDPEPYAKMSAQELADCWHYDPESDMPRLPIKTLKLNRCPAVAPLSVLDKKSQQRLKLDLKVVEQNFKKLKTIKKWPALLSEARELMDALQEKRYGGRAKEADAGLYDGFFENADRSAMSVVQAAAPNELNAEHFNFHDARLKKLLPLYKARNFPNSLLPEELDAWQIYKTHRLLDGGNDSRMAKFKSEIARIKSEGGLSERQKKLLKNLEAYAKDIMPAAVDVSAPKAQ